MCNLTQFIDNKMKMTAIYQPVIINCLLKGKTDLTEIAQTISILLHGNLTQTDNYIKKLKIHPNAVLKKHGIAEIKPRSGKFTFIEGLNYGDISALITLTDIKIQEFLNK